MIEASPVSGLRALAASLTTAAAIASAAAAGTANLTDVRVGVHGDHTRIVLETDGKAPYIVDATEREVIVHVDAAASAEAVTAKSPHLLWAKVEPTPIGADVRISLKQPADVKAMVLTGPDRIVLDLYPKKGVAQPLPAPELLTEEEEPAVTAEVGEPEAAPALEEPAEPEAEPSEELAAAEEAPEAAVEPGAPEPAQVGEVEAEEPEAPAEAAEPEAPPEPEGEALAGAEEPAPAPVAMVERPPRETAQRPPQPAPEPPTGSLYGSPYLLGAAVAALIALLLFVRRRLGSAPRPAFPEPRDDAAEPYQPPQRAVPVDAPSASGESLFDVEADALDAPPKDDEAQPLLRRASPASEDETERRIAHLERRIEELVDARERLERQVAAQTEELRVQRAAIARTQRVLRTVAPRTDEESSSEPVRG